MTINQIIRIPNHRQYTALQNAITRDFTDHEIRTYLVKIAPHLMDHNGPDGSSMLHEAIMAERYNLFKFMLEQGASVTSKNTYGLTALHFATGASDTRMLQACVLRGADLESLTLDGLSAYDMALRDGHQAAIHYLKPLYVALAEKKELNHLLLKHPEPDSEPHQSETDPGIKVGRDQRVRL